MKTIFSAVISMLVFLAHSEDDYRGTANPICSYNGAKIFYLNGILSNEEATRISSIKLGRLIEGLNPESRKKALDENGLSVEPLWNHSNGFYDFIEVGIQKIQERFGDDTVSGTILSSIVGSPPTSKTGLILYTTADLVSTTYANGKLASLRELYEHYSMNKLTENSTMIKELADTIYSRLKKAREKVIIVSHSQGNLFANLAYARMIKDHPEDTAFIDNYLANLQVASPSNTISIHQKSYLKLDRDKVVDWQGYPPNLFFVDGTLKDSWGHEFDSVYLSDTFTATIPENKEPRIARNCFLTELVKLARNLPSNCCRSIDGTRNPDGHLQPHPDTNLFFGGWVASTASVSSNIYISPDSEVCDMSEVYYRGSSNAIISGTHIRGNTKMESTDSAAISSFFPQYDFLSFPDLGIIIQQPTPAILIQNSKISMSSGSSLQSRAHPGYYSEDLQNPFLQITNSTLSLCMGNIFDSKIVNTTVIGDMDIDLTVATNALFVGGAWTATSCAIHDNYEGNLYHIVHTSTVTQSTIKDSDVGGSIIDNNSSIFKSKINVSKFHHVNASFSGIYNLEFSDRSFYKRYCVKENGEAVCWSIEKENSNYVLDRAPASENENSEDPETNETLSVLTSEHL